MCKTIKEIFNNIIIIKKKTIIFPVVFFFLLFSTINREKLAKKHKRNKNIVKK